MKLVAIVTDIGGPIALHGILSELPGDFSLPVLVLQSTSEIVQDSAIATLRRTTELRISQLSPSNELRPGVVYFAESSKCYLPEMNSGKLLMSVNGDHETIGCLGDSLVNLADLLGPELAVVFLSGRGNASEISRICAALESSECSILVLSHLESVLDELGRSALQSARSASELSASEIVQYLLNRSASASGIRKTRQKVGKR